MTFASNITISAVTIGVVVLEFQNNRTLVLPDVLYVPNSRRNLISVSKLINNGFTVSFTTDTSNSWCIISSGTNHICNMLQGFRSTRQYSDGEIKQKLASNATASMVAIGVVVLEFHNNRTLV